MLSRRPVSSSAWPKKIQRLTALVLFELLMVQPVYILLQTTKILAAGPDSNKVVSSDVNDSACLAEATAFFTSPRTTIDPPPVDPNASGGATNGGRDINKEPEAADIPFKQVLSLTAINNDARISKPIRDLLTSQEYRNAVLASYGSQGMTYYKAPNGTEYIVVCSSANQSIDLSYFNPAIPISPATASFFALINDPQPKIKFENQLDYFALTGERCQGGFSIPFSQWASSRTNPCKNFNPADAKFSNGTGTQWHAPIADARILRTLVYLVTPVALGGAGREYIQVKSITKNNKNNADLNPAPKQAPSYAKPSPSTSPDPLAADPLAPTPDPLADSDPNSDTEYEVADPTPNLYPSPRAVPSYAPQLTDSAQYVDPSDIPWHPAHISTQLRISAVDKFRVTTKVVKKRLLGNNTTTYTYQAPSPVKVGWQTNQGLTQDPPPNQNNLSMLGNSRFLMNQAIIQLLNQYGIGDLNVDASSADIKDLGDVGLLVGKSLLEQIISTPKNSIEGWDLSSTLQNIGRAYLEQQLGLVRGALQNGNDYESIVRNIGRTTVEFALNLPKGSLQTDDGTSKSVLESTGRRYLESEIFKVSPGTLQPSDGFPINTVGDLLARLGEGRIEQAFKLPAQSLRKTDYVNKDANLSFRHSSFKATLIFGDPLKLKDDDVDLADYLSTQLNLAFVNYNGTARNQYGFSETDFNEPSLQLAQGKISLQKFKQIVGSRVIETGLGAFHASGTTDRVASETTFTVKLGDGTTVDVPTNDGTTGFQLQGEAQRGDNPCDSSRTVTLDKNGNHQDLQCTSQPGTASISYDLQPLNAVNQIILSNTIALHSVFIPDDATKPDITDFNKDGDKNRRFNAAYLKWIQDNTHQETLNALDPYIPGTNNYQPPTQAVHSALVGLAGSDPDISARLQQIQDLYAKQSQLDITDGQGKKVKTNLFDLTPLVGLKGDVLDKAIVDRLNAINTHPAMADPADSQADQGQFVKQYTDLSYDGTGYNLNFKGWNFLLEDLKARLACRQIGGTYQYDTGSTSVGYICSNKGSVSVSQVDSQNYTKINAFIDGLLSKFTSMTSALFSVLDSGGVSQGLSASALTAQSMLSVAAGLPGQLFDVTPNGTYDINSIRYRKDPLRAILGPVRDDKGIIAIGSRVGEATGDDEAQTLFSTYLSQIGRIYAAKKFSDNILTQRSFASLLKTDFKSFNKAANNLKNIGLSQETITSQGLANHDFSRIYQLNLANNVFDRVGKEELLRVAWKKSKATAKIESSEQFKTLLKELDTVNKDVSFYETRYLYLRKNSAEMSTILKKISGNLKNDFPSLAPTIDQAQKDIDGIGKKSPTEVGSSSASLSASAEEFEPGISGVQMQVEQVRSKKDNYAKLTSSAYKADFDQLENLTLEAAHTVQEIAAGKELPKGQTNNNHGEDYNANLFGKSPVKNQCFSPGDLITSLTHSRNSTPSVLPADANPLKGKVGSNLGNFVLFIGSCQLDNGLGLPSNTIYNWYLLGQHDMDNNLIDSNQIHFTEDPSKIYDLNNVNTSPSDTIDAHAVIQDFPQPTVNQPTLYENIGSLASIPPAGRTLALVEPPKPVTWSKHQWTVDALEVATAVAQRQAGHDPVTIDQVFGYRNDHVRILRDAGIKLLELTALSKLASLIPGAKGILGKLTAGDLSATLQGDMRPLIAKIGGPKLDAALSMPPGTAAQLMFPPCTDNTGKLIKCINDPTQPGSNADNKRLEILATVGLNKLGLEIPNFPTYFDFRQGGDIINNWGNARISQDLGLLPNSFAGKITDPNSILRVKNDMTVLMNGFGFSKTPLIQKMLDVRISLNKQLDKLNYGDIDLYNISAGINRIIDDYLYKATFGQLDGTKDTGYFGSATNDNSAFLVALGDQSAVQGMLDKVWKLLDPATTDSLGSLILSNTGYDPSRNLRMALVRPLLDKKSFDNVDFSATNYPDSANNAIFDVRGNTIGQYNGFIDRFQKTMQSLDGRYKLSFGRQNGAFEKLVTGQINAESINKSEGLKAVLVDFFANKVDQFIAKDGPAWLQDISAGFKDLTSAKEVCGGDGVSVGGFLGQIFTNDPNTRCNIFKQMGNLTGAKMLYSTDPAYKNFRGLVFDKLLAQTFSTKLELNLGIQHGTFKSIAINPRQTGEILVTQGVLKAASQIFGSVDINNPCAYRRSSTPENCDILKVKAALKESFLAGFYDPRLHAKAGSYPKDPTKPEDGGYTTKFSTTRALNDLNQSINREIDKQLGRIGKQYIGTEITRADLNLFLHGDGRFFGLIGVQFAAFTLNNTLEADHRKGIQDRKAQFKISYDDVRASVGLGKYTPQQYAQDYQQGERDYASTNLAIEHPEIPYSSYSNLPTSKLVDLYNSKRDEFAQSFQKYSDPATTAQVIKSDPESSTTANFLTQFQAAPSSFDSSALVSGKGDSIPTATGLPADLFILRGTVKYDTNYQIEAAGLENVKAHQHQIESDAQQKLKFQAFDIVAFKFDQNIPAGFTQRIFGTDAQPRAQALTEYAINIFATNNKDFQKFMSSTGLNSKDLADFSTGFVTAFTTHDTNERSNIVGGLLQGKAIDGIDGAVNNLLAGVFNVSPQLMPQGLFKGVLAWGKDGFQSKDFNRQIDLGKNIKVPAIGKILEDYGINLLANWGDTALHLKKGTTDKIIKVTQAFIDLSKAYSALRAASQDVKFFNDLGKKLFEEGNFVGAGAAFSTADDIQSAAKGKVSQLQDFAVSLAIDIFVNDILGSTLAKADTALGLPPGTMAQIFVIGITAILTSVGVLSFSPIGLGISLFMLAISLIFGVVKVVVTTIGTADGYYPMYRYGTGEAKKAPAYSEHVTSDSLIGTFDPSKHAEYYAGLKKAAQAKVTGLMRDLMLMPTSAWAQRNNLKIDDLWIYQGFSYGDSTFDPRLDTTNDLLIHRPLHTIHPDSAGYGTLADQCININADNTCDRKLDFNFGFYPTSIFDSMVLNWKYP
jgi:hypothetical protein